MGIGVSGSVPENERTQKALSEGDTGQRGQLERLDERAPRAPCHNGHNVEE